jgi:hypothetical protein
LGSVVDSFPLALLNTAVGQDTASTSISETDIGRQ